jgi:hypothetical protein
VKEPAFLMAMQWVVRRVEIQDNFLGRFAQRVQEHIDQQGLEPLGMVNDLLVPALRIRVGRRQF